MFFLEKVQFRRYHRTIQNRLFSSALLSIRTCFVHFFFFFFLNTSKPFVSRLCTATIDSCLKYYAVAFVWFNSASRWTIDCFWIGVFALSVRWSTSVHHPSPREGSGSTHEATESFNEIYITTRRERVHIQNKRNTKICSNQSSAKCYALLIGSSKQKTLSILFPWRKIHEIH